MNRLVWNLQELRDFAVPQHLSGSHLGVGKQQYIDALPKILANPFGNGIGEGASTLGDYNRVGILTIDSYYLVLALEYGVLGFLAYATLIFAAIHQAVRFGLKSPSREGDLLLPAAVFLIVFVIVKGVLAQDDNHSLTFMVLGMVVALAHRVRSEGVAPKHRSSLPA